MKPMRIPLRAVFYREDDRWVAHCLEMDLAGDGETRLEAAHRLCEAVRIQLEESVRTRNWRNLFSPADSEFFEKFAEGTDIAIGELRVDNLQVEGAEASFDSAREYSDDDLCLTN